MSMVPVHVPDSTQEYHVVCYAISSCHMHVELLYIKLNLQL
jgi:hypothetical protein